MLQTVPRVPALILVIFHLKLDAGANLNNLSVSVYVSIRELS